MKFECLGNLAPDLHRRIERAAGVLKDHGDIAATDPSELVLRHTEQFLPRKTNRPFNIHHLGEQAENAHHGQSFTRPRLTDKTESLSGCSHKMVNLHEGSAGDADTKVVYFKHHTTPFRDCCGSKSTAKPSPRRLNPSTVTTMNMPGKSV